MIPVDRLPEPINFDDLVRIPGQNFLISNPRPSNKDFKGHDYWRAISPDLYNGHQRICAYSCHYIDSLTGSKNVEHFLPKSEYPLDAYEWANYRLVCAILNSRKGVSMKILDPFIVRYGWFIIDFPSMLIKPGRNDDGKPFNRVLLNKIKFTIERLRLNDEPTCLDSRRVYIKDYCEGRYDFKYLEIRAPFIAYELQRQNLITDICKIWIP